MFYFKIGGFLKLVAVRVIDDVLITGDEHSVKNFVDNVKRKYELGTIVIGPTEFLFFGLHIIQDANLTVAIHVDSNLNALSCFPIVMHRRKQVDQFLNEVEKRSFRSINSSISWLGSNVSLFCSFHPIWLQ